MMSLTIKKTALAAAIGLSISASPVGAFPFWSFSGFGGSGALGGDNQYAPFAGRYLLKDGGMQFDTTSDFGYFREGTLTLWMELEGRAYDFPTNFPGRDKANIIDPDENVSGDEYIELGDFSFNMTFEGAFFSQVDGADFLNVPSFSQAQGTLTYDTDMLFEDVDGNQAFSPDRNDNGIADHLEDLNNDRTVDGDDGYTGTPFLIEDISVDGERQGDVVFFSTPNCFELSNNPGRSNASCTSNVFELFSTGGPADAYTPVNEFGGAFDDSLGTSIPTGIISLFHAGLPCPPGVHADNTAEKFYCDPIAANFPVGGIPVPGDPQGRSYETYAEYVAGFNPPGHVAFINVQATPTNVPAPATGLLLGAGLAGLGFARRRARTRSGK